MKVNNTAAEMILMPASSGQIVPSIMLPMPLFELLTFVTFVSSVVTDWFECYLMININHANLYQRWCLHLCLSSLHQSCQIASMFMGLPLFEQLASITPLAQCAVVTNWYVWMQSRYLMIYINHPKLYQQASGTPLPAQCEGCLVSMQSYDFTSVPSVVPYFPAADNLLVICV